MRIFIAFAVCVAVSHGSLIRRSPIRQAFERYDANGDRQLDRDEAYEAFSAEGYTDVEIQGWFDSDWLDADRNHDDKLNFKEFLAFEHMGERRSVGAAIGADAELVADFKHYDANDDGHLSKSEARTAFRAEGSSDAEIDAWLKTHWGKADANADGSLSVAEFIKFEHLGERRSVEVGAEAELKAGVNTRNYTRRHANHTHDNKHDHKHDHERRDLDAELETDAELEADFNKFDIDNNGMLSKSEAKAVISAEINAWLETNWVKADLNGDGELSVTEFIAIEHADERRSLGSAVGADADLVADFKSYDANGDGKLSKKEASAAFSAEGSSKAEIDAWFKNNWVNADVSGDGELSLTEFIAFERAGERRSLGAELGADANLEADFNKYDKNHNGKLSKSEARAAFSAEGSSKADIDAWIKTDWVDVDANGDGELTFAEFVAFEHADERRSLGSAVGADADLVADFKSYDANGDGKLSKKEASAAFSAEGSSKAEIDAWFKNNWVNADVSGDGELSLTEFIAFERAGERRSLGAELGADANLEADFNKYDKNHNGKLSKSEARAAFSAEGSSKADIDAWIKTDWVDVDANGDGELTFAEFVAFEAKGERRRQLVKQRRSKQAHQKDDEARQAFLYLDMNADGYVSTSEADNFMNFIGLTADEIEKSRVEFKAADKNSDKKLSWAEFKAGQENATDRRSMITIFKRERKFWR